MKKLGMAMMVSLMATAAFAGGPIIAPIEAEPVVVVTEPGSSLPLLAGGLTGTTLAAALGALLLLGVLAGGGSSSSTTTTNIE